MRLREWFVRASAIALVSCALHPVVASAATDTATLTIGRFASGNCGGSTLTYSGYPWPGGSYSPTGLTGGETVIAVQDITCGSAYSPPFLYTIMSQVQISGFSADPGQAWLTSITCNTATKTSATASGFSYSSGTAIWAWTTTFGFWLEPVGTNYSCRITHT